MIRSVLNRLRLHRPSLRRLNPLVRRLGRFSWGLLCAALLAGLWQTAAAAQAPAQVRVAQLMPAAGLTVHSQPQAGNADPTVLADLSYQSLSDYQALPAGRYTLTVASSGQTLLRATYGIGASDRYTLALFGLVPESPQPNSRTAMARLKGILGGVDAHAVNGYLPQMTLLRDRVSSQSQAPQVRLMHLAPGVVPLAMSLEGDSKSLVAKTLAYPNASEALPAEGATRLAIALPGQPTPLVTQPLDLKAQTLTTVFVAGGPAGSQPLAVVLAQPTP